MMKAVKLWSRVSREAVNAPSLFRARLDGDLSNLV